MTVIITQPGTSPLSLSSADDDRSAALRSRAMIVSVIVVSQTFAV